MEENIQEERLKDKQRKLCNHEKFSKVSFIFFIVSFIFYLYVKVFVKGGYYLMVWYGSFFYQPYIIYLILQTLIVVIFYKKILKYNFIAFGLLFIVATLNYTGFSFYHLRYISKAEQIDTGLLSYKHVICYDKRYTNIKEECPFYTLDDLKQQYPQCFTKERPDSCELYQYFKIDKKRHKFRRQTKECLLGLCIVSFLKSSELEKDFDESTIMPFIGILSSGGIYSDDDLYPSDRSYVYDIFYKE